MPIDVQCRPAVTAIALLAILSGCAMQPSAPGPEAGGETARARGEGAPAAPAERAPDAEVAAAEADAAGADAAGAEALQDDPIAAVLAERRRGDYPEIEVQPTGFTITEQVRIGGSARSRDGARSARAGALRRRHRDLTAAVPDATVPYIDLGIAYRRSGQLEKSEEALDTAALLSPDHPIVHNELGIIYRETGRFDEARASYERALAVFADFHFARRNLAVLCDLYLADLQCALEHYRAFLEAAGSDAEVEIWIADVANRLGDQEG